jgi:hypothetical protein
MTFSEGAPLKGEVSRKTPDAVRRPSVANLKSMASGPINEQSELGGKNKSVYSGAIATDGELTAVMEGERPSLPAVDSTPSKAL